MNGKLDTLLLGEAHQWAGFAIAAGTSNDKDVLKASCERVADLVLYLDNIEGTWVPLDVQQGSNTSSIASLGHHDHDAELELDVLGDFTGSDVHLDGVMGIDVWVRIADVPGIVGDEVGDVLLGLCDRTDTAEFVLLLSVLQAVEDEASLGIVKEAELVVGCLELKDVHEAAWEVWVSAHTAINLDMAFHADHGGLLSSEGILEAVAQAQDNGKALAQLVGARRRAGCPHAAHFVKHPVLGGVEPLQMLLGSSGHVCRWGLYNI